MIGEDEGDDELRARLPPRALSALLADAAVRTALRSSRLRSVLRAIDCAQDRVAVLESMRRSEGDKFTDFLDDMLVAMGVAAREQGGVVFSGLEP